MKRILIVNTNSVNADNATGVTLRSIFKSIDRDSLAELYWNNSSTAENMLEIDSRLLRYSPLSVGAAVSNKRSRNISTRIKTVSNGGGSKSSLKKWLGYLRQYISLCADLSGVVLSKKDMEHIKEFSPDVIYTLGGGVASLKMSYRLSKKLDIPIIIHFMDNWRHCIQWEDNPFLNGYKRKLRRYCDLCYSRSAECIAISPKMAQVYTDETGIKHSAIMNSVNVDEYICSPRKVGNEFNFVYAGGLHLGRNKALADIGNIIEAASEKSGVDIKLLIYTSEQNISAYRDDFKALKHTFLFPAVEHEKIKDVYEKADVLVHIESNALVGNEFFKFSISTKMPEYLATGKPILFYGPSDIYLYEFLKENNLAVVADNYEMLSEQINSIIENADNGTSDNSVNYAKAHFDVSVAVKTLKNTVDNSAYN